MWAMGSPWRRRPAKAANACSASAPGTSFACAISQACVFPSTRSRSMRASSGGRALCAMSCARLIMSGSRRDSGRGFLAQRGELLRLVLGDQRPGQFCQVAVHDVLDLVQRQVDAVVGDTPLREVVGANALGTVAAAYQALARRRLFRRLFPQLLVLDARRQHRQSLRLVIVLRAPILALHHDAGGQMRHAHGGIGLVDVLPAGTGSAESIYARSEERRGAVQLRQTL